MLIIICTQFSSKLLCLFGYDYVKLCMKFLNGKTSGQKNILLLLGMSCNSDIYWAIFPLIITETRSENKASH